VCFNQEEEKGRGARCWQTPAAENPEPSTPAVGFWGSYCFFLRLGQARGAAFNPAASGHGSGSIPQPAREKGCWQPD